jgi:hypothetical protein
MQATQTKDKELEGFGVGLGTEPRVAKQERLLRGE